MSVQIETRPALKARDRQTIFGIHYQVQVTGVAMARSRSDDNRSICQMESPNDQDWVRLGWIFLDPKIGVVRPPNLPELRTAASHALDLSNEFPDQADPPPTNWLPTDCRWTPNEAPGTRVLPYLSRTEAEEAPRARECLPQSCMPQFPRIPPACQAGNPAWSCRRGAWRCLLLESCCFSFQPGRTMVDGKGRSRRPRAGAVRARWSPHTRRSRHSLRGLVSRRPSANPGSARA